MHDQSKFETPCKDKLTQHNISISSPPPQKLKKAGEAGSLVGQAKQLKAEAERLDVMDKAAGVLAELLFDGDFLQQIKEYRALLLVVCSTMSSHALQYTIQTKCIHIFQQNSYSVALELHAQLGAVCT